MIFITGGTGFVGRHIVKTLSEKNERVVCLVRNSAKSKKIFQDPNIELEAGDINDPESLTTAMRGCRAVIHLVGIIQEPRGVTFEKIHHKGTANVIEAAKDNDIDRIIYISALGTRPEARSRYHKSKWQAEEVIRTSGLNYTILRPSIIFGPDDQFVNVFARIIKIGLVVPVIGSGKNKLQPIHVDDFAAIVYQSLENDKCFNQILDIAGPQVLSINEILKMTVRVLHRKRLFIHIPIFLARFLAYFLEHLLQRPPFTRDQIKMLQEDNICNITPLIECFGVDLMSFEKGIQSYLK